MLSKLLSAGDQRLIAQVIAKSDFGRTVEPGEVVSISIERLTNTIWVQLINGCIPFCRDWFKATVQIVKAEQAAPIMIRPTMAERLQQSGAYKAAAQIRAGKVKVSPYCGAGARSWKGVQPQLRTESTLAGARPMPE